MDFMKYITENALIIIPVLYIIGMILKNLKTIPDKYIPLILLPFGIVFSILLGGLTADAVIQGVLVTGAAVYCNQLYVQGKKEE